MHVIYHAPGERQTETANTGTVDIYQLATTAAAAVDDAVAMPCATGRATCTSSGLHFEDFLAQLKEKFEGKIPM